MRFLLLDTSTEQGIIALAEEGKIIAEQAMPEGLQNSKSLSTYVAKILKAQQWSMQDLKGIIVGVGPGSFTGLRVAASFAKAISYARQIPLIGVPSLLAFAKEVEGKSGLVFDARAGGAYFLPVEYKSGVVKVLNKPVQCSIEVLANELKECIMWVSPHAEKLRQRLSGLVSEAEDRWEKGDAHLWAMLQAGSEAFHAGSFSLNGELDLLYMRPTQAEREQKNKLSSDSRLD